VAKVAFLARSLELRGTGVATFDYAEGCQSDLGHEAVVLFDAEAEQNPAALAHFQSRFKTIPYEGLADADRALERERADLVHVMKGDARDRWASRAAPMAVHQVFPAAARDAHGAAYAYVSQWLAQVCAGPRAPFVPHVVALAEASGDLREALNIPADALVLGCHGGAASFDLAPARAALARARRARAAISISSASTSRRFLTTRAPASCRARRSPARSGNSSTPATRCFMRAGAAKLLGSQSRSSPPPIGPC
jgi:hypothetical protein